MRAFVIINNVRMICGGINAKNQLMKVYVIQDLFECECDKSCDFSEYLDYENCKCGKKSVHELVERSSTDCSSAEECTENADEVKIAETALFELANGCV